MELKLTAEWVSDPYQGYSTTKGYGTVEVKLGKHLIHTIDRYWVEAPSDEDLLEVVAEWLTERLEKKEFRV